MQRRQTGVLDFIFCLFLAQSQCVLAKAPPVWADFTQDFIEQYFTRQPAFAAQAGRHEFDGKLPNWSPRSLRLRVLWLESIKQTAERYPAASLNPAQTMERQYLLSVVQGELFWLQTMKAPYKNPMHYSEALDPNLYINRPYAPPAQRMRAFIQYAHNIPRAAAQIRHNLHGPLPRTYINVGQNLFSGLAKFYANEAKAAFSEVDDPKLQKEFDKAQIAASHAMSELAAWLDSKRGSASDDFALGAEHFRDMLRITEGVDIAINDLQQAGQQDLDRNLAALREACSSYAPQSSLADCVAKVEAQKPAAGPVAEAEQQLIRLKTFVEKQGLVSIPGDNQAMVAESPAYKRWNTAYIDIPGPFETGMASIYYVSPPDPAWSAADQAAYLPSTANLLFISAHEVWPGHFLQNLHAQRAESALAQLFGSYAFSEGWAHYSEELMWEAGLNNGDSETHIGQLLNALIRDVRFLAAIGLHTQGMSVETAEQMFREQAFRDPGNARQQAARGTFDPGYLNYTLGKLMIRKLRQDWTATRGGREAWKAFHDQFLSYGAPAIPLVRKAMLPGDGGNL